MGQPDEPRTAGAADPVLELAYQAAQDLLKIQDSTLGNTRSRANNLLATGALLTSVAAGLGLLNTDSKQGSILPSAGAWTLLALWIVLGLLVLYVLWPVRIWHFGPDPSAIMAKRSVGASEVATREYVVEALLGGIGTNDATLRKRQRAFRWAAIALVVEVVALVSTLALHT